MFQQQRALFVYCVSPVHMGAGTALGVIDNPIQRERHTDHPVFAGSGVKGAVRHDFWAQERGNPNSGNENLVRKIFGPSPEDGGSDNAGAISFSDAQLVVFPVRSIKEAFVYTTCPTALARAARILALAGVDFDWGIPTVSEGQCATVNKHLCSQGLLLPLESFEYQAKEDPEVKKCAIWLAEKSFPGGNSFRYFREKMKRDLVVLSDEDFGYFVRNATVVEPHVRIDDITGTAQDGGLFYTENLPPECLMLTLLMASQERTAKGNSMSSEQIMKTVLEGDEDKGVIGLNERCIQIGGDATTGRGQVIFKSVGGSDHV